ncbi:hypothetical protein FQA39_LY06394 [Lamprigera yunnana]|nr:hypothetical protein FQA39_LY06394 [Lamprigera yunnana]
MLINLNERTRTDEEEVLNNMSFKQKWLLDFITTNRNEEVMSFKEFKSSDLIPDLINVAPHHQAVIKFSSSGQLVNLGNLLKPSEVQDVPTVVYPVLGEYFTLMLVDPDAPSRKDPLERSFVHWLVVNIHRLNIDDGDLLAEFIGSAPPPNSGLHRYTFLVYKQPRKLQFSEAKLSVTNFEERKFFSVQNFVSKYNLGNPVAGNFYLCKPEGE